MYLNGPERPSFLYLGYLTCLPNLPNRLIDDGSHAERVGIQAEKKYHFRMQKLKFWNQCNFQQRYIFLSVWYNLDGLMIRAAKCKHFGPDQK